MHSAWWAVLAIERLPQVRGAELATYGFFKGLKQLSTNGWRRTRRRDAASVEDTAGCDHWNGRHGIDYLRDERHCADAASREGNRLAWQCPLLALSGHHLVHCTCPLFGGKADIA
jgi:hypothetical protein